MSAIERNLERLNSALELNESLKGRDSGPSVIGSVLLTRDSIDGVSKDLKLCNPRDVLELFETQHIKFPFISKEYLRELFKPVILADLKVLDSGTPVESKPFTVESFAKYIKVRSELKARYSYDEIKIVFDANRDQLPNITDELLDQWYNGTNVVSSREHRLLAFVA